VLLLLLLVVVLLHPSSTALLLQVEWVQTTAVPRHNIDRLAIKHRIAESLMTEAQILQQLSEPGAVYCFAVQLHHLCDAPTAAPKATAKHTKVHI
jgi:hypothetical protein